MSNEQLINLFQKYLNRPPSNEEISIHVNKNFTSFEYEISNCQERKIYLSKNVSTKKKIALLLSGHIRLNSILKTYITLIGRYDIDVFIHTWDNIGKKGTEMNLNGSFEENEVTNLIKQYPTVRKFKIENNKKFINGLPNDGTTYFNYSSPEVFLISQLYSINQSFDLMQKHSKENDINYDVIIRSRFDSEITHFNLNDNLIDEMNNLDIVFVANSDCNHNHLDYGTSCWACDNMYYQHNLKHVHIFEHTNIICDIFSYGSFSSMEKYCSLYHEFHNLNQSFVDENLKFLEKTKVDINKVGNVYKIPNTKLGHLNSLYYFNCSYPERLLQKHLKDYMVLESKEIKIKFKR